jgi:hypothetical protein
MQFNDAGEYDVGGQAVYYFGDDDSADRRTSDLNPVTEAVSPSEATPGSSSSVSGSETDETSSTDAPGSGVIGGIMSVGITGLVSRRRMRA